LLAVEIEEFGLVGPSLVVAAKLVVIGRVEKQIEEVLVIVIVLEIEVVGVEKQIGEELAWPWGLLEPL
jgi:hypothetical protein